MVQKKREEHYFLSIPLVEALELPLMSNEQAETSREDMNTPKLPALARRLVRNIFISA